MTYRQLERDCRAAGLEMSEALEMLHDGAEFGAGDQVWTAVCSSGGAMPPLFARTSSMMVVRQPTAQTSTWAAFLSKPFDVEPGQPVHVAVECLPLGPSPLLLATLHWYDGGGRLLARDLLDWTEPVTRDGLTWSRLARFVDVPQAVRAARIQLGLAAGRENGVVWNAHFFWNPLPKSDVTPPTVTLAAAKIALPHSPTLEANLYLMQSAIEKAATTRTGDGHTPDLVCLSETFLDRGVSRPLSETAQSLEEPSPEVAALCRAAKRHEIYVCTSVREKDRGQYYNTAFLIDADGHIAGKYRKTHLAVTEIEAGCVAGDEFPVFDTKLGRIGMLVCWDFWYPEPARILALKGADMILVPLAGDGSVAHRDHAWPARAMDNCVALVVSGTTSNTPSRVIGPDGEILAETNEHLGLALASVRFDQRVGLHWLSVGPSFGETSVYFQQRRPDLYGTLTDPLSRVVRPGWDHPKEIPADYVRWRTRGE